MMTQQTQRSAAEGAKVRDGLTSHSVVAEFADMRSARAAVEALGKAGVEGDNISVTGPAADRAAEPQTDEELREKTREIDSRMAKHMLSSIGVWTVGGVIAGALLGIPVSIGIMAVLGADITLGRVLLGMFFTALAVGIVGWLIPHTAYGAQAAPPWELTFAESEEGRVRVGVHSDKPEDIALAEETLGKQQSLRLYRAGADGRPIS